MRLLSTAAVALSVTIGLSAAKAASPCDNPHDNNPANSNNLTPACGAVFDAAMAEFERAEARETARLTAKSYANQAKADWEAAEKICNNILNVADDPRAPLCQQVRERAAAIAKATNDAQKAAQAEILRRALTETPAPQKGR
jgi:hypothetical protein